MVERERKMDLIGELIKDWERSAMKYRKLGMDADHNPIRQEGLLCRAEVYEYCAHRLKAATQPTVEGDAGKCVCWYDGCTCEFRDKKGMCNC